ncbi:MAG: twin-arginine translocation signal domain-containing protein, partial [Bacteroidota bacterium]
MNLQQELHYQKLQQQTRRTFLKRALGGAGAIALGSLMGCGEDQTAIEPSLSANPMATAASHYAPKAKR